MDARDVARGLGWFSVALGVSEVLGGRMLGGALGLGDHAGTFRAFGLREMAAGAGLLAQDPDDARGLSRWLWVRVGGDVMDLAALGLGVAPGRSRRGSAATALAVVGAITAVDIACAVQLGRERRWLNAVRRALPGW